MLIASEYKYTAGKFIQKREYLIGTSILFLAFGQWKVRRESNGVGVIRNEFNPVAENWLVLSDSRFATISIFIIWIL